MAKDGGLRTLFRLHLKEGFHWQSIESPLTGGGIPDLNGCCGFGTEFWIELKTTKEWAVTLAPDQVGWITQRIRRGGRVFIAVRRQCVAGLRREAADELWLFRGSFARELKENGLRRAPPQSLLGMWTGGPSRWDWTVVNDILQEKGRPT